MIAIPIFKDVSARNSQEIELDGTVYRLQFAWNAREGFWYIEIAKQDGTAIVSSVKMTPNYLLIQQYRATEDIPPGDFLLVDLEDSPQTSGVTFDNYGVRYILEYITREELDSYGIR